MDEVGIQLRRARDSAIVQLDEHLTKTHQAVRLDDAAISARFGKKHAVWKLVLDVNGEQFELAISVGDTFPFEPPVIRFADAKVFLRFPHVDDKGKICLTNAAATYSPNLVTQTVDFLITETHKLIGDSLAGRNEEDFVQEFQSYWRCLPSFSIKKFWSLLSLTPSTRSILYYAATGFTLFGESEDQIKTWLKNYNGGSLPKGFNTKPTVLVWSNEPISPRQYPKTAHDILTLARNTAQGVDALLEAAIPRDSGNLPMILGFHTKAGPILAGVELSEPKAPNRSNPTKQQNSRSFGFRPRHVPARLLLSRYFSDAKPALAEVTRVDPSWCLHRGGSSYNPELFGKQVAIVGCGSLGADIAVILAKSGVGRFVLIDNDILNWGNVARHALGGEYAGQAKATALANYLEKQMPWIQASDKSQAVETYLYERPKILQECDLIISTTGDWACDCTLNAASRTFAHFPPVIFGWIESFGIAGHALSVLPSGGCLACGMNQFGSFAPRVTEWTGGQTPLLQAAGCNDLYQPYGVTDAAPTKVLIAELALDVLRGNAKESALRTWVGNTTRLTSLGGQLHGQWCEHIIPGKTDQKTFPQSWPVNPKCPLCI